MTALQILIADDHKIVRSVIRTLLEPRPDFEICGEARNGRQAVEMARQLNPDIIVLDISMPVLSGFDAAQLIKRSLPNVRIVMLSVFNDSMHVDMAKTLGLQGYISKMRAGDLLLEALDAVSRNQLFFPSADDMEHDG